MAKWQRIRIEVPKDLGPAARERIGIEMRNAMQERAQSGVGVDASGTRSKRFPGYSKEYKAYKASLGLSTSPVNLTLSAEMLAGLQFISSKPGSVLIGMDRSNPKFDKNNAKAEGNILGSYGRAPNPSKARNFLGLPRAVIEKVIKDNRDA